MGMNRSEWHDYFESSGVDIWTVIKEALRIGASEFPSEFHEQRVSIAEILFAPPSTFEAVIESKLGFRESTDSKPIESKMTLENGNAYDEEIEEHMENNHDVEELAPPGEAMAEGCVPASTMNYSDNEKEGYESPCEEAVATLTDELDKERQVLNQVREIKGTLAASSLLSDEELVETLQKLDTVPITVEMLKETEIGKQVNTLKKHQCKDVRIATRRLINSWKEIVDDWVQSASAIASENNQDGKEIDHDQHFLLPSPPMSDEELMAPTNSTPVIVDDLLVDFEFNENNLTSDLNKHGFISTAGEEVHHSHNSNSNLNENAHAHEDDVEEYVPQEVEEYVPPDVDPSPPRKHSKKPKKSIFIDDGVDDEDEDEEEEDGYEDEYGEEEQEEVGGEYHPMMVEMEGERKGEKERMRQRREASMHKDGHKYKETFMKHSMAIKDDSEDEEEEEEFYVYQERKGTKKEAIDVEKEREREREKERSRLKEKAKHESYEKAKKINERRQSGLDQTKMIAKTKPHIPENKLKSLHLASETPAKRNANINSNNSNSNSNSNVYNNNNHKSNGHNPSMDKHVQKEMNDRKHASSYVNVKRSDSDFQSSSFVKSSQPLPRIDSGNIERRLAEAKKRLRENYEEIEMAKKSRTIQVLEPKDVKNVKNRIAKTHTALKHSIHHKPSSSLFNRQHGRR